MQKPIPALPVQKSDYIIRLRQAIEKTKLSRSTIYSLINSGDFPQKIKLSPRTIGFLESEVDAWIADRAEKRHIDTIPPVARKA